MIVALALPAMPAAAAVRVVATLGDLGAIAHEVGGADATVTVLAAAGVDPHRVDPRPNLILPLHSADLLLVNGLGLEDAWLAPLLVAARNGRIQRGGPGYFDTATAVRLLEVGGAVDRSQGDVHPGGNPHHTFDPRNGARIARALADRLAAIDPAHAAGFRSRAKGLADRLDAFAASWRGRFGQLAAPLRQLVTYHKSLTYLEDWLGLDEIATVEPRPGIPPDPGHITQILQRLRATGTHLIVQEEYHPRRTSETLARLVGARLITLHGATRCDAGESYLDHLRHVAEDLVAAASAGGQQ